MRWEYHVHTLATGGFLGGKFDPAVLAAEMNRLGKDGWELCSSLDTNSSYGQTRDIVLLFKRPHG
jgi:hypothetical protein